jgi:LPS sulfotransferase NodH
MTTSGLVPDDMTSLLQRVRWHLSSVLGDTDYRRFLVLSRSRTGSYLFTSYLSSHPQALAHGEIFRRLAGRRYGDVLERAFGRYPARLKAVGFKLFYYHPLDEASPELWEELAADRELHVIHLVRRDLLKTLVSRARAQATDEWKRTVREPRATIEAAATAPMTIDEKWFEEQWRKTRRWQEEARSRFPNHPFLEVTYEELVKELQPTFDGVTDFLGLARHRPTTSMAKQSSAPLEQSVSNLRTLQDLAERLG